MLTGKPCCRRAVNGSGPKNLRNAPLCSAVTVGHLPNRGVLSVAPLGANHRSTSLPRSPRPGGEDQMKLSLPLAWRREVAERTMSFAFDFEGQSFPFKSGQYVQITQAAPRYLDEKGNSRSFSIASSPDDPFLLIATRLTGSAFKRSLAEASLGTRVDVRGPMGSFVLPQDTTIPTALVAGGIGITPFRSMIKTVTERKLPYQLTLICSNRTPRDAPFLDELAILETANPNFRLVAT